MTWRRYWKAGWTRVVFPQWSKYSGIHLFWWDRNPSLINIKSHSKKSHSFQFSFSPCITGKTSLIVVLNAFNTSLTPPSSQIWNSNLSKYPWCVLAFQSCQSEAGNKPNGWICTHVPVFLNKESKSVPTHHTIKQRFGANFCWFGQHRQTN